MSRIFHATVYVLLIAFCAFIYWINRQQVHLIDASRAECVKATWSVSL